MQSTISYGRPVNGSRARLTRIGTVTTTEAREHRISYETASWYTLVSVPAGTYDVVLHETGGRACVLVQYAGTITDEHFVNRLFGSSSLAAPRNIGQPGACSAQMYPYSAAEKFATDPAWELADDWSTESEERTYQDGRAYTAHSLHRPDGTRVF